VNAFTAAFLARSGRVRRRLLARRVLTGFALGSLASAVLAAVGWWLRLGELRIWAGSLALAGAVIGYVLARRKRWSDSDVALYLDARLKSEEAISTAVELQSSSAAEEAAHGMVLERAASVLGADAARSARPRVLRRPHLLAPVAAAALVALNVAPLPPAPPEPVAPGTETVRMKELKGLERIARLDQLSARDSLQKERLAKLAAEAKKLRADLANGIARREAQARVAKLRDDIAKERLSLGDGKNRAGLESAVGALENSEATRRAAKALGNADLTEFDREMQKLANQAEASSRKEAKRALEEAAKAARAKGARDVERLLEEQRKLFEEREAHAEALRELAQGLSGKLDERALEDLREFGRDGSPEAQKRLADALGRALKGLTPEEREKLLRHLQKQLEQQGGPQSPLTKEQLEELAKELASPEGQQRLEEMLKQLAEQDPDSESERQRRLDDADRGGAEAERGLGVMPVPVPSPGGPMPGAPGGQQGSPGKDPGAGSGSGRDTGRGDHAGKTDPVPGNELRAKANAKMNPGAPMHEATLGRTEARPGETARQKGVGALGKVGPAEVGGVEGSEVPEEYREQVGRYFQP
jgi:hypothetical protein